MAANDITITAANVHSGSAPKIKRVQFGATITAGQVLYLDNADSKYKLADANNTTTTAGADGIVIALTNGADADYGLVAENGLYDVGGSAAEGKTYVLSDTPGAITLAGDQAAGWNGTIIGVGAASNQIDLRLYASGQTVA